MTVRRKFYNQKRHIIIILLFLFLFMMLVRLLHTIYWVIRLNNNGFMIDNVEFDPVKGPKVKFSVKTYEDCPLNFDISAIKASIGFEKQSSLEGLRNLVVQFHISNIRARKHVNMNFDGFVEFDSCDFGKFSSLIGKRKLEFNLKMCLNLRFLMLPLAFSINKTVYTFDPARFNKNISTEEEPTEIKFTDDICENINALLKKDVFKSYTIKKVQYSLAELRQEAINNGLAQPESQAQNENSENHSDLAKNSYYEIDIRGNSLIKSIYVNNININVDSRRVKFLTPFNSFIIIRKFVINKTDCMLTALIPDIDDSSLIIESFLRFFTNGNLKIKIESFSSILANDKIPKLRNDFSITLPFSKPANEPFWPQNYKFIPQDSANEKSLDFFLLADLSRVEVICFMFSYQILKDNALKLLVSACNTNICRVKTKFGPFFNLDDPNNIKSFVFHQNIVKGMPLLHFTVTPFKKIVFNLDQELRCLFEISILNKEKFFDRLKLRIDEEISLFYRSFGYKMFKNIEPETSSDPFLAPEVHNDNKASFENDGSVQIFSNAKTRNEKNCSFSAINFDFNFDLSIECKAIMQNLTKSLESEKDVVNLKTHFKNCKFGIQFGKNITRKELFYLDLKEMRTHIGDFNENVFDDIKNIKSVVFSISISNRKLTEVWMNYKSDVIDDQRKRKSRGRTFLYRFLMENLMFDQLIHQKTPPFIDLSVEFFAKKKSFIQGFKFFSAKALEPVFTSPLFLSSTFSIAPIIFFDEKSSTCISLERTKICFKKFYDGVHIYIDNPVNLSFDLFCFDSLIAPKNNFTNVVNYPLAFLAIKKNICRKNVVPKLANYPLLKNILDSRIVSDSFNIKLSGKEDQISNKLILEASLDIPNKCAQLAKGFGILVPESYELIFTQVCQNQRFSIAKDFLHLIITNSFTPNELQMKFKLEIAISDDLENFTTCFNVDGVLIHQKKGHFDNIKNAVHHIRRFTNYSAKYIESLTIAENKTNSGFREENFLHMEHVSHGYEGDDLKTFVNFCVNLYSDHINEIIIRTIPPVLAFIPIKHLPETITLSLDFDIKSEFQLVDCGFLTYEDQKMQFTIKNLSVRTKNPLVYDLLYLEPPPGMPTTDDISLKNREILEKMYNGNKEEIAKLLKKLENVALKENFKDHPFSFSFGIGVNYIQPRAKTTDSQLLKDLKINTSNFISLMKILEAQDKAADPSKSKVSRSLVELIDTFITAYTHGLGPEYYLDLNINQNTSLLITGDEILLLVSRLPIRLNIISSPLTVFLKYSDTISFIFKAFGPLSDPVFEAPEAPKTYNFCFPIHAFIFFGNDVSDQSKSIDHYRVTKYNEENCRSYIPIRLYIIAESDITVVFFRFKNNSILFRSVFGGFNQCKSGIQMLPTVMTTSSRILVEKFFIFCKHACNLVYGSFNLVYSDKNDVSKVEAHLDNSYSIGEYNELYLYREYAMSRQV